MKKTTLYTLALLVSTTLKVNAQTITIHPELPTQSVPEIYQPGVFLVPKTPEGTNDFLNNGIYYNSIRTISIETAMNYWTVSSINDVMSQLESQKNNILLVNSRCDKLILPILKMPIWLSSSTDTTDVGSGFKLFNAVPPASYSTWNLLMDSIVSKINDQWGLDPYYEFWNEPDVEYWQGTEAEYFELFRNTYFAIKGNHPNAKFGGPTVSNFVSQLGTLTFTNGYLQPNQLDSTVVGRVIDSCMSWNATLDFISWHKFGTNLYALNMEMDYLNQKLTSTGHGIVPFIVSEWNMPASQRESALDPAFMVNYTQATQDFGIHGQMVAAWQDFNMDAVTFVDSSEFHRDYGLLSWGGLHKPSWKSLQLLNKLQGELLEVDSSNYRNLCVNSAYNNDTLQILVSNYSLPGTVEATLSLYYDHQINALELINEGYTAGKLDSVYRGLIVLSGADPLSLAINSVIPTYQQAEQAFQNGRDIILKVSNLIGTHNGTQITIDSTRNNVINAYDSLISIGFIRTDAVSNLHPNNGFDSENISMVDSLYSFHLQSNGVSLIELYVPGLNLSVEEAQYSDHFNIYPNPTTGHVSIDLGSTLNNVSVRVLDALGREIERSTFTSTDFVEMTINGEAGQYFVEVNVDGVRAAVKRVIKK